METEARQRDVTQWPVSANALARVPPEPRAPAKLGVWFQIHLSMRQPVLLTEQKLLPHP